MFIQSLGRLLSKKSFMLSLQAVGLSVSMVAQSGAVLSSGLPPSSDSYTNLLGRKRKVPCMPEASFNLYKRNGKFIVDDQYRLATQYATDCARHADEGCKLYLVKESSEYLDAVALHRARESLGSSNSMKGSSPNLSALFNAPNPNGKPNGDPWNINQTFSCSRIEAKRKIDETRNESVSRD